MKFMKNAALHFALALSLILSAGLATAASAPVAASEQSDASVNFLFGEFVGHAYVYAMPGSSYTVNRPAAQGGSEMLACGVVGGSGIGASNFQLPAGLIVTDITVTLLSPGQPAMLFAYDSELDRWILD